MVTAIRGETKTAPPKPGSAPVGTEILWQEWLERLESADADWSQAEEFAASVLALAERKRRAAAVPAESTFLQDPEAAVPFREPFERARNCRTSPADPETLDLINQGRTDPIRCPSCGSLNIRYSYAQTFSDRILSFLFAMDPLRCRSCRNRFYRYLDGDAEE